MDEFLDEIWGIDRLCISYDIKVEADSKIAAIILLVDKDNIDRISNLSSFKDILDHLKLENSLYGIQVAQIGVINGIKNIEISKLETLNNLKTLKLSKIIDSKKYEQIQRFLNTIEFLKQDIPFEDIKQNFSFYKSLDELNSLADELSRFDKQANDVKEKSNNSEFVISVTGVINAGKSSMLNSFLGSDILGTSNIPETANLSLLKYGKSSIAKIVFYNDEELKRFGIDKRYEDKTVPLSELINYTSAQFEISKYIKMIELSLDLPMLKDNISIVDTPGLDDTVVLREELTKYFMDKSDTIIHLMNASQSSTKKDISFIVDTLQNSKNSSLIVVLTHSDLLSEEELVDVVSYTEKSIKEELLKFGFATNLIDNVKYFKIDNISKNGIYELKNYIYNMFFGKNSQKANLIIQSYLKELKLISSRLIKDMEFKVSKLSKNNLELESDKDRLKKEISNLESKISDTENEINGYLNRLDYSDINFELKFKDAFLGIKDGIILDLKYNESKKTKPDFDRIKTISQSRLKDIITDVLRDIAYQISKDIELIKSNLKDRLKLNSNFSLNIKKFIDDNLNEEKQIKFSYEILEIIKKNLSLEKKSQLLESYFDMFLNDLDLKNMVNKLSKENTSSFKESLKMELLGFKKELENKQSSLEEIFYNKQNSSKDEMEEASKLKKDLNILKDIEKRLNNA
ncbi:GTP-binding protein (dynamin domain) [Campylobacter blaseri]|uniref:GTP-binding protein n=1 Tax=Campylobacter blaseri TaxID=2042961 RepID=A0A2P8QYF4_9BACT|nr:dynamin family protein [Campylobacter blaseri]PSM51293.1 GTP-binding protein [Campylobacter blaseri]PSM52437.1 GTP-binding protein [Campylobacter blaseri]QKF86234.1 GTP-binding protein (dynamin domain) [Campylobacter blaseri]